jgi:hypothetical protein
MPSNGLCKCGLRLVFRYNFPTQSVYIQVPFTSVSPFNDFSLTEQHDIVNRFCKKISSNGDKFSLLGVNPLWMQGYDAPMEEPKKPALISEDELTAVWNFILLHGSIDTSIDTSLFHF